MSKAILLMDMPTCCGECSILEYCHNNDGKSDMSIRQSWCPLREVPERKDETWDIMNMEDCYYNDGWNDCINEILKEGAE